MWLFGQVWFACLVGFAVGVALDWVVRVRPLGRQVADLEARLAAANRKIAGQDGDPVEGYRRSVFDRGQFDRGQFDGGEDRGEYDDDFVTERNRSGLTTPSDETALLGTDSHSRDEFRQQPEPHPVDNAQTEIVRTGVEDFPGVARLSGVWDTDRDEAVPLPPRTETWSPYEGETPSSGTLEPAAPPPYAEHHEPPPYAEHHDLSDRPVDRLADHSPDHAPEQEFADQQYLEFLRAGANHAPVEEDDEDQITTGSLEREPEYTGAAYERGRYEYEQPVPGSDETAAETTGDLSEVSDPGANEVTSVIPVIRDEAAPQQPDGYAAYEGYAQEEYQHNGYSDAGYATDSGFQYGSYQPEEYDEPEESATPLPRRHSGEQSLRFTPFAPFDAPFDMSDSELVDAQPRGQLTPIEDGGWQPFQKPAIDESTLAAEYSDGAWIGDDGRLVSPEARSSSSNGSHVLTDPGDPNGASWFDQTGGEQHEPVRGEAALTQRMLPVSRPDLAHPDLLPQSVFGTETDTIYEDEGLGRSLFEPVIQPEAIVDDFDLPSHYTSPADLTAPHESAPQEDLLGQTTVPRPIRVRTGMDGTESSPSMAPVSRPDDGSGDGESFGPFGPGSALPNPDGSAPSPEFRIKARTSSMVFHTESSPFYERLEPQVWFRDADEAQRAGFTSWERPRTW